MTMQLCCRDVGLNCDFEARGNTEEEVLQKTSAHARWVHQVTQMSLELENRIRAAIRTV
jgi:predicted small metal-binding protein